MIIIKNKPVRKKLFLTAIVIGLFFAGYIIIKKVDINPSYKVGDVLDRFQGVAVYYNGGVDTVVTRNTKDGYNLGLKYQCVEFVKRFYYVRYQHKMPDSYGHARDFYNPKVKDGQLNKGRGLLQFSNPGMRPPKVGDLLVYGPTIFNFYGHVSIVSKVDFDKMTLQIIQQNAGQFGSTRKTFKLNKINSQWKIDNSQIKGWLSLPDNKRRMSTLTVNSR